MSNMITQKPYLLFLILIFGLLLVACSPSAEKLNQEGNQAFTEQAYLEALEAYQNAQIESPELAEPYYNSANAYYRQGQYEQALEQLQHALQFAEGENLAENSLYNLGNNFFKSQELETAIEAYKSALLIDPHDQDAKYNLELALQQQEQQQQQEQDQQQQDQQQQDQQQEQQEESQGENQGEDQDQPQHGENQDQGDQEQNKDSSQNQDQNDSGEDQSENQDQENQGEQQDGSQFQGSQNQDSENGQPGQMPPPGQRMTEEQARQLLAALSENMDTLQERLGEILFVRKPPPVQDW